MSRQQHECCKIEANKRLLQFQLTLQYYVRMELTEKQLGVIISSQ